MTKIADDSSGRVLPDGSIEKPITNSDFKKLEKGVEVSKEILRQVGVKEENIFLNNVRGAHVGGTAAMRKVINENFEIEIDNRYVCDASVLPSAPGNPPILTIVALAKRLAANLAVG